MKKKYSATIKNLKEMLQEVMIYTTIVIILQGIFYFYLSDDLSTFIILSLLIFIVYLLTVVFPIIVLYQNYINYNKNSFLVLEKNRLIINENNVYIEDIVKIKIYATHQHFNNHVGATSLPYNDYFCKSPENSDSLKDYKKL